MREVDIRQPRFVDVNTPLVDGVAPDLEMDCMAYGMGGCAKSHAPQISLASTNIIARAI